REDVLEKLDYHVGDPSAAGDSLVIPVKRKKTGGFTSTSKVADEKQFSAMMKFVQDKAEKIGEEIFQGNTRVNPYEMQQERACEYCPYVGVCGFDENLSGYAYRRLEHYDTNEIWEKIKEEGKEEHHGGIVDPGTKEGY
ncbi:ATP-dependent nuclease subunit B, partial [gut metagenome]